jgi:hypothetical protein
MYPELSSEEGLQDAFRYINNKKLGKTEDELVSMFGDAFPMLKKKASLDSGKSTTVPSTGQEKPLESESTLQSSGSAEPSWATSLSQVKKPDVRPDGSKKGMGFLGPLPTKDGRVATEMSIGVEIDGKETLIPTLIPTLSKEEREWILGGGDLSKVGDPIGDAITDKAVEHAKDRMSKGQSPFAGIKTKEWSTEPVKNPFAIPRNPTSEESKRLIDIGAQTSKDRELFPDSNDIDAILGNPNFSTTNADFKQFVNPAERGNPAKRFGNERYTSEEMAGKVKRSDASIAYFMELEKKREKQIEGLSEKYQTLASAKKAEIKTSVQDYSNKVNTAYKDKVAKFVASLPKPQTQEEAAELQKQANAYNKKTYDESNALISDFEGKKNEELKSYVETNLATEMIKEAEKGGIYYNEQDKKRVANIFSSQKFQDLPFIDQKALVGGVWYREKLRLLKQGKTPAEIADAKDYFYYTALGNSISRQQDRPSYLKPGVIDQGPNYGSGRLSSFAIRSWAEDMSADLDKRIAEQKKLLPEQDLNQQQEGEEVAELQLLLQAKRNIDQVKSMPDNNLGSWYAGISDANKIPFVSTFSSLADALNLGKVASKTTRTASEDLLVMSQGMIDDLEASSNPSIHYKIGKQTGQMLPYIGELLTTGGAFTAGKAATQRVLTEALTKKFGTWATKSIVQKSIVKPAGLLVGALAQTAVNPQQYIKNTIERMNPIFEFSMSEDAQSVLGKVDALTKTDAQGYSIGKNEDALVASFRGLGMTYSEMFTERLGEALLSPALKAVTRSITPEFAKRMTLATWMTKRGLTPEQGVSEILLKQMGWDGIISEMGEELINIPLTNIITDRPLAEGASGDELKVLAGSVVSMSLLTGSVSLVGNMATSPVELKYRDTNGEEQSIRVNKNLAKAIQYMASRTAPTEKGAVSLDYFDIQEFKDKVFGNVRMDKKDREVVLGLINGIQDRLDTRQKPGTGLQFSPRRGAEDFQEAVYADGTEAVSDMLLLGPIDQEEADVYEVQADNVPETNIEQEAVELEIQLADQSLSDIERTSLEQRKVELEKVVVENASTIERNEWSPKKNDLAVGLMKQYNSLTPAKKNSKKGVQLMNRISSLAGNFELELTTDEDGKIALSKDGSKLKATPIKTEIETPDEYDIDYAKSMLKRGVVLPDIDFGITPAEAEKGMQDVLKGNMTNPAKMVVAGLKKSREFGGYDVIERDENNRPTGNKYFISFDDIEVELNEPVLVEPDQEEKLAAEFDTRMSELTDEQLEQIYLLSIDEEQELPISQGQAPVAASKEKSTDITSDEKGRREVEKTEDEIKVEQAQTASPTEIEAGRQEVSAVKKGEITTTNPIRLFKGLFGKRNLDGTHKSAHPNVKGVFSAVDEKVAERYKGEDGVGTFDIPAGTTIEVVRLENKNMPIPKFRDEETEAINASDAQIVKLITLDARGAEEQYIIKDPALIKMMQKPESTEEVSAVEDANENEQKRIISLGEKLIDAVFKNDAKLRADGKGSKEVGLVLLETLTLKEESELYKSNDEYRKLFDKSEDGTITEKEQERLSEIYVSEKTKKKVALLGKLYQKAKKEGSNQSFVNAVDELLANEQISKVVPELRDVESTAKALEAVIPKNESFAFAINTLPIEGTINYKDIKQKDYALPFERYVNSPDKIDKEIASAYKIYKFLKDGGKLPNNVILLDKNGEILDGNNRVKAQLALGITDFKYAVADEKIFKQTNYKTISEAYHKAKLDGSNPELVKTVESLLSKEQAPIKGEVVSNMAVNLGSDQGGISDFTANKIKEEDYEVRNIPIEDLLNSDEDLAEYIDNAEEVRDFEGEPFDMLPVVTSKGEVVDGYNRIHQAIENGESSIEVYYGILKTKAPAKEQPRVQLFSHFNTNHGATNTIYYDNGKFIEVENYARGKEFEITKDEAIAKKWESESRGPTPPIKQVDKDRIEGEFNDKISTTEVENKEQEYKQIKTIRNKLKFVDDNFNGIVAQLILKNKVKRVC